MKTLRIVQILASTIGVAIALRCVDNLYPTGNELMAGMALVVTSALGLISQRYMKEIEE